MVSRGAEKRDPEDFINFQGLSPSSSTTVYLNEQGVKQRCRSLHGWTVSFWLNPNMKRKNTRGGRRARYTRRNIEALSKHGGMKLGKPWATWSRIWWRMWKSTRRPSTGLSLAKGRLGKMWSHYWVGWGTWWSSIKKKPTYSLSLYLSLFWWDQTSGSLGPWDLCESLEQATLKGRG